MIDLYSNTYFFVLLELQVAVIPRALLQNLELATTGEVMVKKKRRESLHKKRRHSSKSSERDKDTHDLS